jgi:hypothetical protein
VSDNQATHHKGTRIVLFSGFKVITDPHMTERVLHARSPARAVRRMKKGYPQHYITRPRQEFIRYKNEAIIMHPDIWEQLKREVPQIHTDLLNPFC